MILFFNYQGLNNQEGGSEAIEKENKEKVR